MHVAQYSVAIDYMHTQLCTQLCRWYSAHGYCTTRGHKGNTGKSSLQLAEAIVHHVAEVVSILHGEAHGRFDAEDVAVQTSLADENSIILESLHHLYRLGLGGHLHTLGH